MSSSQARKLEVEKIKRAIRKAIPLDVEITSILLALSDIAREFTTLLIKKFDAEREEKKG